MYLFYGGDRRTRAERLPVQRSKPTALRFFTIVLFVLLSYIRDAV